jgi:hypothetical protein
MEDKRAAAERCTDAVAPAALLICSPPYSLTTTGDE